MRYSVRLNSTPVLLFRGFWILLAILLLSDCGGSALAEEFSLGISGDGVGLSFAYNPSSGTPSFAFFNQYDSKLYFVEGVGSSEKRVLVDGSPASISMVSSGALTTPSQTALIFFDDAPHIFYHHPEMAMLRHAYRSGGKWQLEMVDPKGKSPSAVNCGSDMCVAYYDEGERSLRLARGKTGSWYRLSVDAGNGDVGSMTSIAAMADGRPAIAYYDSTYMRPKVAFTQPTGAWQIEALNYPARQFGVFPSIAVAPNGTLLLTASELSLEAHDYGVYFAKREPNAPWSYALISKEFAGGPTQLYFSPSGAVAVVSRYLKTSADAAVTLRRLTESGIWQRRSLPVGGQAAPADIEIEREPSSGAAAVAYRSVDPTGNSGLRLVILDDLNIDSMPVVDTTASYGSEYASGFLGSETFGGGSNGGNRVEVPAGTSVIRINSGGSALVDQFGRGWAADTFYSGGFARAKTPRRRRRSRANVEGSPLASSRDKSFSYAIPVENGRYRVVIHARRGKGRRAKFLVEGKRRTRELAKHIDHLSFPAVVGDGALNLRFDDAKVLGIEVVPSNDKQVLINSGGTRVRDQFGRVWQQDRAFRGGRSRSKGRSPGIFGDERMGRKFAYSVAVAPGNYLVMLHMKRSAAESRLSVYAEGGVAIPDMDLRALPQRVTLVPFEIAVTDGRLNLEFASTNGSAAVAALEIDGIE